ncbi:SusC/RagA family TonB-linked outer membrane protein [Flavobacterium reichenbachii]|uniref:TonB-dependent receptor n=1 Tax=Flavobacterium reichenbachii TaxID=362418 RepID=A0A085ZDH8_9FLAO|nr:TonB-dependent receptor [Flavobacterium reichenbachii]KFF02492.1 TonB-dependent receptor [Flavobacterium reichenbachii]OXB13794.1 SusC/RagA family TonB-linked outer membrane protein [Flavobacterium reichenbachii]
MKKLMTNFIHWNANHIAVPLILFLLLTSNIITAQVKVTGIVSDDKGLSIPGANITVVGTKKTTSTDFDGNYSIDVPANASISVSFIGYITQTVNVKNGGKVNVILRLNAEDLREVLVNVGYRNQKRKDITGAVSSVSAKDFKDSQQVTVEQMLQGRAAGVVVTNNSGKPGGSVSVKIRGNASLGGSNEPLYIVDGIPISGDATSQSTGGTIVSGYIGANTGSVTNSPLAFLNPNDIETMDILKDAASTAVYGSRASNGVVIITTKRGKKGAGKITYDTAVSTQEVTRLLKTMSLSQYAEQQNALAQYYGVAPRDEFAVPSVLGKGTNWQDEIYRSALMTSHQLSFSGANETTNYYVSGSYLNQEGVVIGSDFKRYTFKTNVDSKVKDWLSMGVSVTAGITNQNITIEGYSDGIIGTTILSTPDVAVKNLDGTYAGPPANGSQGAWINPVASTLMNTNYLVQKNFNGTFYSVFKLAKGLEYRFELGANTSIQNFEAFQPTYNWGAAVNKVNQLQERSNTWYQLNLKNMLTYRFDLGKHNFNIMGIQEATDSNWFGNSQSIGGLLSNDVHSINLGDQDTLVASEYKGSNALYSFLATLNYSFDNRYSLQATIRADGSSNFAKDKRWGYFPSVSAAWNLSNEKFMESTKDYVDNIKFRIGYGETGNQVIGGGLYLSNIQTIKSALGNFFTAGNIANPGLTWQTAEDTNLGLEFSLFHSKLNATVDVYRKQSSGFLFVLPLPTYVTGLEQYQGGLSAPTVNLGSMRNEGIEATLKYSNKFSSNFSWDVSANFSKNNNKLLSLADNFDLIKEVQVNGYTTKTVTKSVVGRPIGQFYGYESVGIIRTNEQLANAPIPFTGNKAVKSVLGDVEYVDQNKDGLIDEKDLTYIGNPMPDFTYGINNTFKYKNLDLSIFLQGSQGGKVMNLTRRAATKNQRLYENQLAEAADFWTPENPNAKYPRPDGGDGHPNIAISDRYVEDGSYLRISQLTFAYNLPSDVLSKTKLSKLRFYASVQNLYTFTKYTGYDPEIGDYNQNALLSGIDSGRYPTNRTITLGMNVEF